MYVTKGIPKAKSNRREREFSGSLCETSDMGSASAVSSLICSQSNFTCAVNLDTVEDALSAGRSIFLSLVLLYKKLAGL